MKKMKDKLVPIMANCAFIIAVIGLSGSISQSKASAHISTSRIDAIQRQIGKDINRIDIINRSIINKAISSQISTSIAGAIAA